MDFFFDLDGTLVDISRKYFAVYVSLVRLHGGAPLPRQRYWDLKRSGASYSDILHASQVREVNEEECRQYIQSHIELEEYLTCDTLLTGADTFLRELSALHRCYLVSMRKNARLYQEQTKRLGIHQFFREVVSPGSVTDDGGGATTTPKSSLIRKLSHASPAMIIGDSGMDIRTGQQLKIMTCAVTTGIRSRTALEKYSPDFIVDELRSIFSIIKQLDGA